MTGPPDGSASQDARRIMAEAARLIDALSWDSPAHTGPECRICPICRLLATLRELHPEIVEHLAAAAEELLAAVREFAGASRPSPRRDDAAFGGAGDDGAGTDGPDGAEADGEGPSVVWAPARPATAPRPVVQHIEITD
jgi:hypothetical protein